MPQSPLTNWYYDQSDLVLLAGFCLFNDDAYSCTGYIMVCCASNSGQPVLSSLNACLKDNFGSLDRKFVKDLLMKISEV